MRPILARAEGIVDNIVFLRELRAISREQGPRRIVQDTKEVYVALRILDLPLELFAVIVDGDHLNKEFLRQIDNGGYHYSQKNSVNGGVPGFGGIWFC